MAKVQDLTISAEDLPFNLVDRYCLHLFPELKTYRPRQEMALASTEGSYIFHEDVFMKFIEEHRENQNVLRSFCDYIEYLLTDKNFYLNQLARVAVLERCIDIQLYEMRPMIGKNGLSALKEMSKQFRMDKERWDLL